MKKIIVLLIVMLAFGVSANAQLKKSTAKASTASEKFGNPEAIQKAAATDLELLAATIPLTEDQKGMFQGLFAKKHRTLADPNITNERKDVLAGNVEKKLKSVLDADQIAKLDSNPDLLKKLTH